MTKFLNNADIKGYIAQTAVTSYLLKADSTGRLVAAIAGTDYVAPSALSAYVPYTGATGNVTLGEYGVTAGYLGFDLTPTSTPTGIGTMYWDAANRTVSLIDGDGDTTLQIGQEERVLIHNGTGATLTDGQVVYVTGSTGELPSVALADASIESTSAATLGMVTETIANGADGFVTLSGIVHGLNTLAFNEGDLLWLSETAGEYTNVKPISPAHLVLIGYVIKKAGGNGSIFVKIQNTQELAESSDVLFTSLTNNDGLFYDSATNLWKNKTIAAVLGYTPANGANYLALTGGTLTGDLTLSGTNPRLYFTDTDNNPDYFISNTDGTFTVYDVTNSVGRFKIYTTGSAEFTNNLTAASFIKSGGTSAQFLKADGSVDSSTYLTTGAASSTYLPLSGGTLTGALNGTSATFSVGVNTNRSSATGSNPFIWNTAGVSDWFLGSSPLGTSTSDLSLYSYGTSSVVLNIARSTGAASFAGSLTTNGTFSFAATGNVSFTSNDANNYARFTGNAASAQIGLFRASDGGMYIGGAAAGFRVFDSSFNTRLLLAPGGQLQLNTYTSATSYSGTAAGYLAFDSSGNVITVAGVAATDNTKLPLAGGTLTGLLAFSNVTGNKIDFYHTTTGSGDRYGVQVQNSELRIHSGAGGDAAGGITFGKSTTTTFTEAMRVRNDGIVQTTGYLRTAGVTSNTVYWSAGANSADFGNALGQGTSSRSTMFRGNGSSTSVWWAGADANGTVIPFTAIDATSGEFTFWRNSGGLGGGSWTNIMTMNANGLSINSGYLVVPTIYSGGGSITLGNNVLVPASDRGFEVNASGGISLYSNEINAGALGGTGTIYLGWRRTTQVNVGVPMALSGSISATSGSFSGVISTSVDSSSSSISAVNNGNASRWYGRITSFNSTSDKAAFVGTYASVAVVGAHNNALTAWANLYVNNVDGSNGGNVYLPTNSYVANNAIIHAGNIGSQSVTYATNSTRLYASDSPYTYGGAAPYYLYMNYDGGSYWELKVSPATPGTVRVAYANSAGSASSASTSSQVTINYNNDSNSTYQLLWGSGNSVYGTSQVYVNPSSDVIYARGGYISPGNPWGTADSAFFPNGITTAGSRNWIYGATYIGNAPGNGQGVDIGASGNAYFRSNVGTSSHGTSARFLEIQSANGNFIPYSFESEYGNHSWGTVLRIRINQVGADRPSMQFSYAGTDNRWNVGYCYPDDQFRVTQNMAYRNDNSTSDGWGTERFRINTNGDTYAAIGGTLYANGNQVLTYAGGTLSNNYTFRSNLGGYLGSLSSPPLQVYSESNNSAFMSFHKGGYYAVNFGLDADNVMRIGGWSASANRWQLDMSGNQTVAGSMYASYFYGSGSIRCGDMWGGAGLYRPSGDMVFGTEAANWVFSSQANTRAYFAGGDGNLWMQWSGEWLSTTLGRKHQDGANPSYGAVYADNWFRAYGDCGLYSQSYGGHIRRCTTSYGTWENFGYTKNGWGGFNQINNYYLNLMSNTSGDHGFFQENGKGWTLFYNRGNDCWGIGTDNTYSGDGFRCIKYGSAEYGWTTWSDRRAKENISTITGALDTVLAMRGVYFNYIKDEAKNKRVGFIAQELESVLPEAVRYAEEIDEYSVEYAQIVSVLAEAIKEQNIKIQGLEAQLQTLLN